MICLLRRWLAAVALLIVLAPAAQGQMYIWNDTTGNWSDPARWTPTGPPASAAATVLQFGSGTADYIATFNGGTGGLPSTTFNLNRLNLTAEAGRTNVITATNLSTNSLTFQASSGTQPTLTFSGGGTFRIANNVRIAASTNLTATVEAGSALVFSPGATPGGAAEHTLSAASGSATFTVEGGGIVVVRNLTTAQVVINNGYLTTDANGDFLGSSTLLTVGANGIVDTGGYGESWNAIQGVAGGVFRGLVSVNGASGSYTYGGIITDRPAGVAVTGFGTVGTTTAASLLGGLTKAGNHTLTVTGASTYTGVTSITAGVLAASSLANGGEASNIGASSSAATNWVINGGTIQYTGGNATINRQFTVGSNGATFEVTDANTTLTIHSTYNANNTTVLNSLVGGATTTLIKTGAGRLTLTGDNGDFKGAIVINGGTLRIADPGNGTGSNGDIGSTSITINDGGTFEFFGPTGNADLVDTAVITINAGGTAIFTEGESYGGIVLRGGAFHTNVNNSLEITTLLESGTFNNIAGTNGSLGGTALVRKTTAGTVTSTGVALNTTGGLAIEQGILSTDAGIGGATGNVSFGTIGAGATTGTLQYRGTTATVAKPIVLNDGGGIIDVTTAATTYTLSGAISGPGSLTKLGAGTLALTATNAFTGGVTIAEGTLQIGNNTANGTISGSVVNNATLAFRRSTDDTFDVAISGTGGVTKLNANTITLTGPLTYTGLTTVDGGVLRVDPTTLAGGVRIASGAGLTVRNSSIPGTLTTSTLTLADGSILHFDLASAGNPTVPLMTITTADGVTLNGATHTLKVTNTQNFALGSFTLLDYTGSPITEGFTLAPLPARTFGELFYNTANTSIDLKVTGVDTIVWTGTLGGDWDVGTDVDVDGTFNWKLASNGTATNFVTGDVVRFDDTASQRDVNLTTTLRPTAITVDTATTYTFRGDGAISGSASLVKAGTGTLTLLTDNTFTGGTTVFAGTLTVGNGSNVGSFGTGLLVNDGTVILDRADDLTLAMTISGSGHFTKKGTNTLTLTSPYTLTGNTVIEGGRLLLNSAANFTVGGPISGDGGLTKSGTGILTLAGNNSYTGSTALTAGTLVLTGENTNAGGLTVASGTTLRVGDGGTSGSLAGLVTNAGAISFHRTDDSTFAGVLSGAGTVTKLGDGTLTMPGANTYTGLTTVSAGTLRIGDGLATTTAFNGSIAVATASLTFDLAGDMTYTKVISGTGSVVKTGAGILTLTGGNSNTGTFTINGGTVVLTGIGGTAGDLDSSAVVVNSGATFQFGIEKTTDGTSTENPDLPANTYITLNSGGTVEWRIGESLGGLHLHGGALLLNGGNLTGSGSTSQFWTHGTVDGLTASSIGGNAIVKTTSGLVSVSGLATLAATVNIQDGTVAFATANNLGSAAITLGTAGVEGTTGTFEYRGATATRAGTFTFTGPGIVRVTDSSAVLTLSGVAAGTGSFTKEGPGALVLTGVGTLTGTTSISSGTLALSGQGSIAKSPTITVTSGASFDGSGLTSGANYDVINGRFLLTSGQTLRGTGTILGNTGGALTVAAGASLDPGIGSLGTLTVAGAVGLETGSIFQVRLTGGVPVLEDLGGSSGGTLPGPTNNTFLDVTSGSLTFGNGVLFQIDGTAAGLQPGQHYSFVIARAGSVTLGDVPQFAATGFVPTDILLTTDGTHAYLSFTTSPVPEPATALVAAAGLLALLRRRARR